MSARCGEDVSEGSVVQYLVRPLEGHQACSGCAFTRFVLYVDTLSSDDAWSVDTSLLHVDTQNLKPCTLAAAAPLLSLSRHLKRSLAGA